jgi:hypothetical protein
MLILTYIKVDSAFVVHHQFNFYIPGYSSNARFPVSLRVIGIIGLVRDYASALKLCGMHLLPILLLNIGLTDLDEPFPTTAKRILLGSLLVQFLGCKLETYLTYHSFGLQRAWNLQASDVWCAPCML